MRLRNISSSIQDWLKQWYFRVFHGAGVIILPPKPTGNRVKRALAWLDYRVFSLLDAIDTKVFFKNRKERTARGRVRSNGERKIARYLENHGIAYQYERRLVLEGRKLFPDFYLPQHNVYVEFWGRVNEDRRYRAFMCKKKELYSRHHITVISVEPRHVQHIQHHFPRLFYTATGKELFTGKAQEGGVQESA